MSEPPKKPLTAAEIEALLRSTRDTGDPMPPPLAHLQVQTNNSAPESWPIGRADVVSNEPLGPGDVQYLQNMGLPLESDVAGNWPDSISTVELLQQAESHLASAMSPQSPHSVDRPVPPIASASPICPSPETEDAGVVPLSVLGDLELDVTLELGRAELSIEDLLALREGAVVTLDKEAGEPIDLLANGKLIARGELIVVDEKFCVRICEVIG